jgi:hypothetical protein
VEAASRPFEHLVFVQPTAFQPTRPPEPDKRLEFQTLYQELVRDELRNQEICENVLSSVRDGRSPLVLTERNDHLTDRRADPRPAPPPRRESRGSEG